MTGAWGVDGRTAMLSEDGKRYMDLTNRNADFIRKSNHQQPCLRMPPAGKQVPQTLHTPHPKTLPSLAGSECTPKGSMSKPLQTAT